jgi:glycolate oxidase
LDWNGTIIPELKEIVGEENVVNHIIDLYVYSRDASIDTGWPAAVAFANTTDEVSKIVKLANKHGFSIIPRGAGSNVCGGVIPAKGDCLILVLARMNKVVNLDLENFIVTVEPGIVCLDLNTYLAPHGFYFPPDPASDKACTLGGMINNNSGGIRAVKYGVTENWVMGLEVVLSDGTIINIGNKAIKYVCGYDLVSLFVGSEGTLGIVTKAMLKIQPLPEIRLVASGYFNSAFEAGKCVREIIRRGFDPSGTEIMDYKTLKAVEEYSGKVKFPECGAVVLVELDGNKDDVEMRLDRLDLAFKEMGAIETAVARDAKTCEEVWAARKAAFPALTLRRPTARMEDVSVPLENLPVMFQKIDEVSAKNGIEIATFGHAGDGNLHPILLWDERDPDQHRRALQTLVDLWHAAIDLEGTVTGEHGIGVSKLMMMPVEHEAAVLELTKKIKHAFDPNNVLCPGHVIPIPGQRIDILEDVS